MLLFDVRSFEPWTWGSRLAGLVLLAIVAAGLILAFQRVNR